MSQEVFQTASHAARAVPALPAAAWRELEAVMDQLGQAARSGIGPAEFYQQLVSACVQALGAAGGAVWLREPRGPMRVVAHVTWPLASVTDADPARHTQRDLHELAASSGEIQSGEVTVADPAATDPYRSHRKVMLLVAPIRMADQAAQTVAILEVAQTAGASPATYRGQERFLTAVCEIAAEYHAFRELGQLRANQQYHRKLFALSRRIHQCTTSKQTAYTIANEGCHTIGCDRLSVALARGRRCRMAAVSHVKRIERRSTAVRMLEKLATTALRLNEPLVYADGLTDALPEVEQMLQTYVDQSHARHLAIVPIDQAAMDSDRRPRTCLGVVIAEQFDGQREPLALDRVAEIADISSTALAHAQRWDRLPLGWLLAGVGRVRDALLPRNLVKTTSVAALVVALIGALVFVETDFHVEAPGVLVPVERRNVFAPRRGLVEQVAVRHGTSVAAGDMLLTLRDSELELEYNRVAGQLQTALEELAAVEATQTSRSADERTPLENYRLSAEQRQLQQELTNLRRELELLETERKSLVVRAPADGNVITWDVEQALRARPVERGELLLTVADLARRWQVELAVPDDRIGYVLTSRRDQQQPLVVQYQLASDDHGLHVGHIASVAQLAEPTAAAEGPGEPAVRVVVDIDQQELASTVQRTLQPNTTVRARIHCGRHSLGYVWLHDVWDKLVQWWTF